MTIPHAEIIAKLEQTTPAIKQLTSHLADSVLDFHPTADAWSIREILAHLVDDEIYVMRVRLTRIVKEDRPDLAPHDEKHWYATRNKQRDQLQELLSDFEQQRNASLAIMRMLRETDWQREGYQPEYGHFTAETWIGRWLDHDLVHIQQIESDAKAAQS